MTNLESAPDWWAVNVPSAPAGQLNASYSNRVHDPNRQAVRVEQVVDTVGLLLRCADQAKTQIWALKFCKLPRHQGIEHNLTISGFCNHLINRWDFSFSALVSHSTKLLPMSATVIMMSLERPCLDSRWLGEIFRICCKLPWSNYHLFF